MPESDSPKFDAAEVRIKFVPDTEAVDAFWQDLKQRRDEFVRETKEMLGGEGGVAFGLPTPAVQEQAAIDDGATSGLRELPAQEQVQIEGLDESGQDVAMRHDVSQIKDKVEGDIQGLLEAILDAILSQGVLLES